MAKVKIDRGLQQNYNAIPEKDGDKIYVCTDSGNIYVGDTLVFEPNAYIDASINDKIVTFTTHGTHGTNGTDTLDLSMFQTGSEVAQAIAAALASIPEYTIERLSVAETGYSSSYILKKGNSQVGATINIPKDMVVSNGEVKTVTTANVPYQGAQVGDKYIDLTIANTSQNHIYIPVKDLVDVYVAGNGIDISASNYIAVKVDQNNSNGLGVGGSGLALYTVSPSLNGVGGTNGAMTAADKEKLDSISAGAGVNVQSDWEQSDNTQADYIKNKPGVFTAGSDTVPVVEGKNGFVPAPTFAEQSKFLRGDGTWQTPSIPTVGTLDTTNTTSQTPSASETFGGNVNLHKVSKTGAYFDLNDKPSINGNTLTGNKTSAQLGLQDTLVSGTSIKTVNSTSLLGSGNIQINDGVGFQTITTQQDGTMVITLTNGNTITVDLNHNHEQYTKVVICASVASYEAITDKDAMTFYIIPTVALYIGNILVLEQGGTPLPYTPIEYIETDGNAYIDTGINGNDPRSCSLKFSTGSSGTHCIIGTGSATEDTSLYALAFVNTNNYLGFGHRYYYVNSNARYLITAGSPFEAKVAMTNGSQIAQLKREGDSSFESYSKTNSATLTTNKHMYLFALNNANTSVHGKCSSGSRLYYCKIYSDNSYSTLVFDGIPCVYNGEYGLWDKKTDTFFGAVSGSGTFTGPSIS